MGGPGIKNITRQKPFCFVSRFIHRPNLFGIREVNGDYKKVFI